MGDLSGRGLGLGFVLESSGPGVFTTRSGSKRATQVCGAR